MMKIEKKGMLSPYTIITCIFTGALFPLLGSLLALDLNVVDKPYYEGIILVMIGGFIAHYLLSHTIHDLVHLKIEKRDYFTYYFKNPTCIISCLFTCYCYLFII